MREEAFIIGGGSSLRGFVWPLLQFEYVIGCNDAYKLGWPIIDEVVFGDWPWWEHHAERLKQYVDAGGSAWTNLEQLGPSNKGYPSWLHWRQRRVSQLPTQNGLGWFRHTGAIAINLALQHGAKMLYLLGFDMKRTEAGSNWHDEIIRPEAVKPSSYQLFLEQWPKFLKCWHQSWPNTYIVNVTDDSDLFGTYTISTNDFWERRLKWNGYNNTPSKSWPSWEHFTRLLAESWHSPLRPKTTKS